MYDYTERAIDQYPKEIDRYLSCVANIFNNYYSLDMVLLKFGWERITAYRPTPSKFQEYNRSFWFSKEYDVQIHVFQDKINLTDITAHWYLDNDEPIEVKINTFKLYSILTHGGNAIKSAVEFLRYRPKLHHLFKELGIDPNNIPNLTCQYPPAPLAPRKLYEQPVPLPVFNPTQSSSFTTDEYNQLISPYSSTDFMSFDECGKFDCFNDGIPLGIYSRYSPEMVRYKGDRHLITIAPTGSGKNTSIQIPILLEHDASIFVIDPKGECAAITARYRKKMGQEVFIINPFNVLKNEFAELNITEFDRFNPLAALDPASDNFVSDVSALCEAIIVSDGKDTYWSDSARDLIACLILFVCTEESERERKNLVRVRELLAQSEEEFLKTMILASESKYPFIANKAKRFLAVNNKSNVGIISCALTQTGFLDDPLLAENLKGNDEKPLNFVDLKSKKITVYVILPAKLILTYSKWFRLLVTSTLDSLMSTHEKGEKPVLVMLDEFPILGYLSSVENAVGLARGFGVQIWTFIQDIHQLNHLYGDRAESFLANTGVQQYFTPNDMTTAERISKRMGDITLLETKSTNAMNTGYLNHVDYSQKTRPLLYPIDIIGFENNLQIVFLSGNKKTIVVNKNHYYENESYIDNGENRYDVNPYYTDN